jgi:hypothetical protein
LTRLLFLPLLGLAWTAGCSVLPHRFADSPDHPAHPNAAETPAAPLSPTLNPVTAFAEMAPTRLDTPGAATAPDSTLPISAAAYYTCPMHPQIHQDHAGACQLCGMNLVKMDPGPDKKGGGQ